MKPLEDIKEKTTKRRFGWLWLFPKAILPLLILAAATMVMQNLIASKKEVRKRPIRERVYTVRTVDAKMADHRPTFSVYGNVVAARSVDLRSLVSGEVVNVMPNLQVGGTVTKDEILVEIDPFQYRGAVTEALANLSEARARLTESRARKVQEAAALERAEFELELAVKDLQRAKSLRAKGNISERSLDDREVIVSQRRQSVEQRRNNLIIEDARMDQFGTAVQRQEWRLDKARRELADTILRAPFDGVVVAENAEPGRVFNVNDVAVRLYDRATMEVRFTLSDQQYGRVIEDADGLIGRPVELVWEVGDTPVTYQAKVHRTGAEIASQRGGIDIYAKIDTDSGTMELRPGAFVTARIPDKLVSNVFRIPESALYGTDTVYVVKDERLEPRKVSLKTYMGSDVLIVGNLNDGEKILTTRIAEVGGGLKVLLEGQRRGPPPGQGNRRPGAPVSKTKQGKPDGRGA